MGFFKKIRKNEVSSKSKSKDHIAVAELSRSSYPVPRTHEDVADSRPAPVSFARTDQDSVLPETECLARQMRIYAKDEGAARNGDTLVFQAFGAESPGVYQEVSTLQVPDTAETQTHGSSSDSETSVDDLASRSDGSSEESSIYELMTCNPAGSSQASTHEVEAIPSEAVSDIHKSQSAKEASISEVHMQDIKEPTADVTLSQTSPPNGKRGITTPARSRARTFLRPKHDESDSSASNDAGYVDAPTENPKRNELSALETRLESLQEQYNQLNVTYHNITANQVETLEIVRDVKSDLCTTQITTAQNTLEILDLQDSRRLLATEIAALQETVLECQQELADMREHVTDETKQQQQQQSSSDAAECMDASAKRVMSESKRSRREQSLIQPRASLSDLEVLHIDALVASGTSRPMVMPTTESVSEPARVSHRISKDATKQAAKGHRTPARFSHLAKEKLAGVAYFHKFRTRT